MMQMQRCNVINSSKIVCRAVKLNGSLSRFIPRYFSAGPAEPLREGPRSHSHFRSVEKARPTTFTPEDHYDYSIADHTGRQQNHIWSEEELNEKLSTLYRHKPATISDHIMNKLMYGMYHSFNFITGYEHGNPSVRSIEWRLLILESIAGVPGFVAAGFRHFKSLRTLQRDHGWISTLLEEAENERMHLLVCLKMFHASYITRALVVAAQMTITPFLMGVYLVHPRAMHRFVGYLEETACYTYTSVIAHAETPGTKLYEAWHKLPAPAIAKGYWKLSHDATWIDTLKCMCADETHHRDVNHTFASMKTDDPSPYVKVHRENAELAWRLSQDGNIATNVIEEHTAVQSTPKKE